jgi:hypothetical protein
MADEEKTVRLKKMLTQIAPGKAIEAVSRPSREAAERGGFKSLGPSDAAAAESGLQKLTGDRVQQIASSEIFGFKAIMVPRNRPVTFVRGDSYDDLQDPWHSFNGADVKRRIATLLPLIGRVEVPSSPNIAIRGDRICCRQRIDSHEPTWEWHSRRTGIDRNGIPNPLAAR